MNSTFIILTPTEFARFIKQHPATTSYYQTAAGILQVSSTNNCIYKAEFVADADLENIPKDEIQKTFDSSNILLVGTEFQCTVWKMAYKIAAGKTAAYQDLAHAVQHPRAVRAVANALANNKIAYFVPCHRVLLKSGNLCGYKWGVERKAALLKSEGAF